MQWIAPTEKDTVTSSLERRLWDAEECKHARLDQVGDISIYGH